MRAFDLPSEQMLFLQFVFNSKRIFKPLKCKVFATQLELECWENPGEMSSDSDQMLVSQCIGTHW